VRLISAVFVLGAGIRAPAQPATGGDTPVAPAGAQGVAVPSHRQADNVAIITIDGLIDKITSYSFQRRLAIAEGAGADAIVVELDTPGGEVGAVLEICNAIRSSPISNSVAWVNPNAYSGGAIIALACKEIVTSNSATMGDALPVAFDQVGRLLDMPEAERQKITAPLLAEVVASARLRGWDEFVVQGFVALGVELWWVRDPATGEEFAVNEAEFRMLFDGEPVRARPMVTAAPELRPAEGPPPEAQPADADPDGFRPAGPEVAAITVGAVEIGRESKRRTLSAADRGRFELVDYVCDGNGPITLKADALARLGFAANVDQSRTLDPIQSDADLQKFLGAKNLRRLEPSWSEWLVVLSTNPAVRGVLLVVFLLMLFLEMSHPGVGLPGAIALVALVGLLAPPALIGLANWWEIGAIAIGILLLFVEILILPGFGVPGITGLLLLFGGMLGTFVGGSGGLFPDSPTEQSNLMYGLLTMILSAVTTMVAMYYLSKHFGSLPILGRLILSDDNDRGDDLLAAMPGSRPGLPSVGARGRAVTALRPSGRAQFGERIVDVVCDLGIIDAGADIRVVSADTFRVVVEQVAPGGGDGPPREL
jgi:membrane-bound serine protease (ClpP class)